MKSKITVGACWDGGSYYSVEYVNILFNAVSRHLSRPFDFVLYAGAFAGTNPDLSKVNPLIKVIHNDLPYWWGAMRFWGKDAPGVETETLLYLDLDLVIVGSLDDLVDYPSDHVYMKDYPADICPPGKENDGNASVVLMRNAVGHQVWDIYQEAGMPVWDPLNPPRDRLFPLAAQGILNDFGIRHDVYPEDWVPSYKLQVVKRGLPVDCKAVSFHGTPKPHDCVESWVKENWR